jgi:3,4-dihydroxy 2-butanone 4-phosphate synthase/GTP cyclohydrolase II
MRTGGRPMEGGFDSIDRAIAELESGRPVVVVDDAARENEGDLVFVAEHASPELLAFMVRHTSGFVCVPMEQEALDRLGLPPMVEHSSDPMGTAYAVTVDARLATTTGISAADRAATCRLLGDPTATRADFTSPGHVPPLRAREGGVLRRPGHTGQRSTWPAWPARSPRPGSSARSSMTMAR